MFWDQLLDLIADGQVIPVVGKDLLTLDPAEGGGILYTYLAERLAALIEVPSDNLTPGDELNDVACRYLTGGAENSEQRFYTALRKVAAESGTLSIPRPLLQLAEIRAFQLFVSTTFDSCLERALNTVRFGGAAGTRVLSFRLDRTREENDLPADEDTPDIPTVYHLLGKLRVGARYAVTQWDMVEFFHTLQSVKQPPLLFDSLKSRSLLILGSQFGGWLARFFLRMAKGEIGSGSQTADYIADPQVREDASLALFIRHLNRGIEIYRGGGAVDFVAELSRRWAARHPVYKAPIPLQTVRPAMRETSGAVFLSYAAEDGVAVAKIKNALEGAGLEVFFDKTGLEAGENWEAKLRRKIRECSLFVPVISRHTLAPGPRFFKVEWNRALEKALSFSEEETFLLPVVIDDTVIDAPGVPEKFRAVQWERVPNGEPTSSFVGRVQVLCRKYHKSVAAGVS